MEKLLFKANIEGVNINHITFTEPSITCYSDACEYGMGGYIVGGPAWRYELPKDLIGKFSINLLEFIAASLTIQFAIKFKKDNNYPHRILAFTNSSSALGWLFKSNFDTTKFESHDKVARDLAWFCISNNVSLFAQHIEGIRNIIADALSRDFHFSDSYLTKIINSHLPPQVRSQMKIMTHQKDIHAWMKSLIHGQDIKIASVNPHAPSKLYILKNGQDTLRTLDSEMYGYDPCVQQTRTSSWQDSLKKSEKIIMEKLKAKRSSWQKPWTPPSVLYQQPLGKILSKTRP